MNIKQRITAINKKWSQEAAEDHQEVRKVYCQGCGIEIQPEDDLSDTQYVKTKRGSEVFFHSGCAGEVWKRGIV